MRRLHLVLGAIVIALAAVVFARAANQPAPAQGNDHILRIAVVNTTRIVRSMHEVQKFQEEFRLKNRDLAQQQQAKQQELIDMQNHRDTNIKPGTKQWQDETDQIDEKQAAFAVWKDKSRVQLERSYKQNLRAVYDHIGTATAQVAQRLQLDLVIADQTPEFGPDIDKITVPQMEEVLQRRAVLYANKKADITEDVLTQVEADYAKGQGQIGGVVGPGSH